MMPARHWELKAEEARAVAGQLRNPDAVRCMLQVAEGYDRLALLSARTQGSPS